MKKLKAGLITIVLTTIFTILLPEIFVGSIFFYLIGLGFFISGLYSIIKDKKTDKKGEICYGIVTVLNDPLVDNCYDTIAVYIESIDEVKLCNVEINEKKYNYKIGECIKVKYYNNDINILETKIDVSLLPIKIQNGLSIIRKMSVEISK